MSLFCWALAFLCLASLNTQNAVSVFRQQMVYKLIGKNIFTLTKSNQDAGFGHSPTVHKEADGQNSPQNADTLLIFYIYARI